MKVLWLCSWYPSSADPYDGDFVERHAKSLALYNHVDVIHFAQNVDLLRRGNFRDETKDENGLHTERYYISLPGKQRTFFSQLQFNLSYYFKLYHVLKKYIRENGKPDLVHVHVPVKIGVGALWLKRKFNIPFVVTEHSTAYIKGSFDYFDDRSWHFRSTAKKVFEKADAVFSVSTYHRKLLEQLFRLNNKPYILRNSVNTEIFFPVEADNPIKQFLHVSMMFPFKNIEGILNALSILNKKTTNWQMKFAGPVLENHTQLSTKLGLDKQIEWTGVIPYTEVAKHMQKADALVHFSKYENLPCVVNEALCCGLPVLSSNVGGIPELVNNSNGILVENGNTEQLANAMFNFLQNPCQFNKQKISEGATALFNYNVIGKQIFEMYLDVLEQS